MRISLDWMKRYGGQGLDIPIDELVAKIGAQLGAIEDVVNLGKKYQGIVVAKVISCQDHPDSDHLHVCKIDDGGKIQAVDRDEEGLVQVVCGAPNVRAGLLVAWLPPGATVPSTLDKDPLVLETRDIRGQKSNGMLASAHELGISDDHDGILELDELGTDNPLTPGTSLAEVLQLDDVIIDIENKMFTHRPDLFGQLGVAREIAGIQGKAFKSPEWYVKPNAELGSRDSEELTFSIDNQIPALVPRYMLAAVDNVTIGPSPVWLQSYLSRVGVRPINNIVDMTNYMMLLTGQPLHAFDYDKVAKNGQAEIVVRQPKTGEKMTLLDGKTIEPRTDAILICDQDKPIALGGMMGGNNSEIDTSTKRILIECAVFDMYNIRRSSMEHGIFTDAVTRFTKGQSPLQCPAVLYKAIAMTQELSPGAAPSGEIADTLSLDHNSSSTVQVGVQFINARLGLQLVAEDMETLLTNVEFDVLIEGENLIVKSPFWRTDIEIPEDVVEEVGRLYGYDKLPLELPKRDLTPPMRNALLDIKSQLRDVLSRAGANEVLTYSFVHNNLLDKVGQNKDKAFELSNALSPDLQYYRMSLMPSLLDKVHLNIKSGFDQFGLFEIGKAHIKGQPDSIEPEVPKEVNSLALILASDDKIAKRYVSVPFFQAKAYLTYLLAKQGVDKLVELVPLSSANLNGNPWLEQMVAPYEPSRAAVLLNVQGVFSDTKDLMWGVVGEFKASVKRAFKLPNFTAGFELDPLLFLANQASQATYEPLPRFPKVEQDITLKVPSDISFGGLAELLNNELNAVKPDQSMAILTPIDIYRKDDNYRNISFRLEIASYERTLTAEEVNTLLDKVAQAAYTTLRAERI